jgi:hypothetical protein
VIVQFAESPSVKKERSLLQKESAKVVNHSQPSLSQKDSKMETYFQKVAQESVLHQFVLIERRSCQMVLANFAMKD